MERTLILVKPDGVQRGLIGPIIGRFESRGLKLVGMKFIQMSDQLAARHYAVHEGKPFYDGLVTYIVSGPVVAMVWEGKDAVAAARSTMGVTNLWPQRPGRSEVILRLRSAAIWSTGQTARKTARRKWPCSLMNPNWSLGSAIPTPGYASR
jgi:nucleoside diphosphate kinase